jgi:hypothetical protein
VKRLTGTDVFGILVWTALAVFGLVTLVLVLLPYNMTGGNVPSQTPQLWEANPQPHPYGRDPRDYPSESIATYQGTPWESSEFLQNSFWYVARLGCCPWLLVMLVAAVEMLGRWDSFSIGQKAIRSTILASAIVITGLWSFALLHILSFS